MWFRSKNIILAAPNEVSIYAPKIVNITHLGANFISLKKLLRISK